MRELDQLTDADLRSCLVCFRDLLRSHREVLNSLNVYPVPDADTGTNMTLTVESVVAALEGATDMASTCLAIGRGALLGPWDLRCHPLADPAGCQRPVRPCRRDRRGGPGPGTDGGE